MCASFPGVLHSLFKSNFFCMKNWQKRDIGGQLHKGMERKWTCIAPIVSITRLLSAQMSITQSYLQIHHIGLFRLNVKKHSIRTVVHRLCWLTQIGGMGLPHFHFMAVSGTNMNFLDHVMRELYEYHSA